MITSAPLSAAHRIARTSSSSEIVRSLPRTTFAISNRAGRAIPAMPTPLFAFAATMPATNVPWPWSSRSALPPTNVRAAAILP